MAQVKLSFRSTAGVRIVATRNLQLTIKKTTRSQKTLEAVLQMKRDGMTETVSSRVAELDQIIPQYLGVSKAILENVIFCHQEDSLWPMSEPSTLKKKFDSIFEADKYTKAIENIKAIRRDKATALATFQTDEKYAKEDKERGERSQQRQIALYDQIEEMKSRYTEIHTQWDEAHQKSSDAFDTAARFNQIVAELNGKRITFNANQESVAALEDNLKRMTETDAELESMLEQFDDRVERYVEQQDGLRQQYSALKQDLDDNRNSLGAKQSEIGKYKAEQDQHARNLQKRENIIKETAKRHGIRGFDYDITDDQVAEFQKIVGRMSRDQNKSLERARTDAQKDLQQAQAEVNRLSEDKSVLSQRKDIAKSQITSNDKRISDLQIAMNQIKADEGAEAILSNKKDETEQRLRKAISEANTARYDERMQEAEKTARIVDDEKERLEAELVDATKLARESAQIDLARDKLKGTTRSLETMKSVHSSRISQLVDPEWEPATLEVAFKQVVSQKAAKVKEAESRRDIAQSKLDNINFKLASVESEQKKKRAELQKYEKAVLDAIQKEDLSDFDETLRELEDEYNFASSDQAKIEAQLEYMRSCLQVAKEHNQCRLCKRTLRDDKAEHFSKTGFISSLEGIVAKAMQNAQAENAEELLAELERVRNAKPSYEMAMRARDTDLPALQAELAKLISERDSINKQLEEHDGIIYDLQNAQQEVESLSVDVQSIVNYYNQARELDDQISDLAEKQKAGGLSRGIDAVQEDLNKVKVESRNAKAALASVTTERDKSRTLTNSLELQVRDINAELNKAQTQLKEKRTFAERIEELRTQNAEQRDAMRGFDKDIQGLIPQMEQAQLKYDDANRRGTERVQHIQEEASKLSDSFRQLTYAEQEISAYIDKGGPQQLARARREIENLEGEINRFEDEILQLTRQIKKMEDTLRDAEHHRQSINDNLRYRRAKRALETLQTEIEELESRNAETDKEHYTQEGQYWQNEFHRLNADKITLETSMKEKDNQLTALGEEYKALYQDAAQKYREMHIKVETTKAACEDLARYSTALDNAIMKYHSLKMEEINRIIDELWRNAYQGTDVDTVRIRSDKETARGNRSYNYRVVMIKNGTEMDMRGRCSAGQKVLASIVIRLALAECFGTNCGLIALDEPTTNLDQQNIKGLAESLSLIIQTRRKQANFQLLVITHDEQFLREMNCADYTDVYWRVGRDGQQESYIERQNISEVFKLPPMCIAGSRLDVPGRVLTPDRSLNLAVFLSTLISVAWHSGVA